MERLLCSGAVEIKVGRGTNTHMAYYTELIGVPQRHHLTHNPHDDHSLRWWRLRRAVGGCYGHQ
jgi:hypothetical protein